MMYFLRSVVNAFQNYENVVESVKNFSFDFINFSIHLLKAESMTKFSFRPTALQNARQNYHPVLCYPLDNYRNNS